ncbi:uncharacterized protein [Primulina eburnea]|uniref:uncharacterized protein n=1 Tax=Primulina eburnea TaxID=1245227 RepID=UPI003C6C2C20
MKLFSWNIRGGGAVRRRQLVRTIIRHEKPDIVVLLETKREKIDRKFVASVWKSRFVEWVCLPSVGSSGGILVLWDPREIIVLNNLIGEFSVSIEIKQNEGITWWFSAIYGPVRPRLRENFWDELAGLKTLCGNNWCLGGDFNVVRNVGKKLNSQSVTTSMSCFDALVEELELHDPSLLHGKFTWESDSDGFSVDEVERGLDGLEWSPLHQVEAEELEKSFDEDEIKRAVFHSDGSKAPGSDGFTMAFFQSNWDTVRVDLLKVFAEFYKDGIVNGITNETYLCLIPKKNDARKINDFRPISLTTTLYKILAKLMRLWKNIVGKKEGFGAENRFGKGV